MWLLQSSTEICLANLMDEASWIPDVPKELYFELELRKLKRLEFDVYLRVLDVWHDVRLST